MRRFLGGDGTDTTAAVMTFLQSGNAFRWVNLYLIGDFEDPQALWLTDYESPVTWSIYDKPFLPAVITRGTVSSKVGLEVATLAVTWSPKGPQVFTNNISTTSPLQLARIGFYDDYVFRCWSCLMPVAGDADTFGACELFGGRIAESAVDRSKIAWTVNSFLDVVNQYYPANVVEATSTLAGWTGSTPPPGASKLPRFNVIAGSSQSVLVGYAFSPDTGHVYDQNDFSRGYVVFLGGPGATLTGRWSAVQTNGPVTIGPDTYNQILLYTELPWPPTPGLDTFYMSQAAPSTAQLGATDTFPYVPNPAGAV